ncbi:scaffolding protein [Pseudomonas phage Eisa9]|uniref:Scaffolding protein n=1 Tax=Pseudomonas phage Eisa9 TaxID=2900148 RepID=A0AAE9C8Z1_9CAUD|nr:scaffolding protein [Pseudomonas phage Eisa9]
MKFLTLFGFAHRILMDEAGGDGGEGGGGPAAAPAAAAPAAAPAGQQADKTEPGAEPPKTEPAKATFGETGNQKVDYALGVIGGAGIGQDHPAVKAAVETGDFSMLQHSLEAAGVPGAAGLVTMLQAEYQADFEAGEAAIGEIKSNVAAIAGGEEQWNEVATFIRDNGTEEELDTLRGMLGDPKMHKIAAHYMTNLYHSAGGTMTPQQQVEGQSYAPRAPQQSNQPITRQEFSKASDELYRKYGSEYESSKEYRALAARLAR